MSDENTKSQCGCSSLPDSRRDLQGLRRLIRRPDILNWQVPEGIHVGIALESFGSEQTLDALRASFSSLSLSHLATYGHPAQR